MLLCEFNKMGWIGGNWKKTLSTVGMQSLKMDNVFL